MEMREVYNQGRQRGESILKSKNHKQIENRIIQIKHDLTILEYEHEYLEAAGLRGELSIYYQNGFSSAFPPKAKY